jgi:hypothetical protein
MAKQPGSNRPAAQQISQGCCQTVQACGDTCRQASSTGYDKRPPDLLCVLRQVSEAFGGELHVLGGELHSH